MDTWCFRKHRLGGARSLANSGGPEGLSHLKKELSISHGQKHFREVVTW